MLSTHSATELCILLVLVFSSERKLKVGAQGLYNGSNVISGLSFFLSFWSTILA
jgi:hypothetical protein